MERTESGRTKAGPTTRNIAGWGVDLDPAKRPGVPMERPPRKADGVHWDRIPQQKARVRILKRRDLENLTPVFGSARPPKGISGILRRLAYRIPDQRPTHWMTLLLADQVDVVESRAAELVRPRGFLGALLAALGGAGAWFLARRMRAPRRAARTLRGALR